MARRAKPFPGFDRRRFEIDNGDGRPDLLHRRLVLERVLPRGVTPGFGDWRPGWYVRVTEGELKGLVLALSPRSEDPIEVQLARWRGWAMVVVHEVDEQFRIISAPGMTGLHEL